MKTYKLSFVLDGYLIETREINARSFSDAKQKLRKQCGKRRATSILLA